MCQRLANAHIKRVCVPSADGAGNSRFGDIVNSNRIRRDDFDKTENQTAQPAAEPVSTRRYVPSLPIAPDSRGIDAIECKFSDFVVLGTTCHCQW